MFAAMTGADWLFCGAFFGVLLFALGFICGGKLGEWIGADAARKEAVEAGAARWEIDAKSGERRFVWLKGG